MEPIEPSREEQPYKSERERENERERMAFWVGWEILFGLPTAFVVNSNGRLCYNVTRLEFYPVVES